MKLIDRVLLVVGFGLAGAGLWWMWSGWDIVQVERGWASVIAGAVMLSGGLVVVSVAWAVMRLSAPQRATLAADATPRAAPQPEAPSGLVAAGAGAAVVGAAVAASRPSFAEEKPEPSERIDEPLDLEPLDLEPLEQEASEPDRPERDEDGVAEPDVTTAEPEAVEPPPVEPRSRISIDEIMRRSVPEREAEPRSETRKGSLFPRFGRERPRIGESSPPAPAVDEQPDADKGVEENFAFDTPPSVAPLGPIFPKPRIFETHAAPEAEAEAESPEAEAAASATVVQAEEIERDDDLAASAAGESPEPVEPAKGDWFDEAEKSLERSNDEPLASDHANEAIDREVERKEPAVTGRYSSGDTNYTMYDDGSIEAQTPDGTMRFASLLELRRFVEQRG